MSEVKLPEGWVRKRLGEVCKTTSGGTPSRKDLSYYTGSIPWVKSGELKNGIIISTEEHISEEAIKDSSAKIFPSGTLLIAIYGATVGRLAFLGMDAATNQAVCGITPGKLLDKNYLYWLLFFKRPQLLDERAGGAQPNISQNILRELTIPLPPIPVQQAIVARIEELFSELDAGVNELQTALSRLKIYRQAVLDWAFEGKLTTEWRLNNKNSPSGIELLNDIRTSRIVENDKVGKKTKTIISINDKDLKFLFDIPNEWCWVKPEDVCSPENYSIGIGPFGSNLKVDDYTSSGVPLIFVKNITRKNFTLNLRYITDEKFEELKAHSVKPLDILVTKMGDPPGDSTIYPEERPEGIITSDCLKFRVWDSFVERKYFQYCIESSLIKRQLGLITQGVAQKKISSERFKTLYFPLSSRLEQIQIVSEIEARLSEADVIEAIIRQELVRAENLRQSILKQAFEGKLVTAPVNQVEETESAKIGESVSPHYGSPPGDQLSLF